LKRRPKLDREATKARGFLDRWSYVSYLGKEFLGAKDWEVRRVEVYNRDEGKCVKCKRPVPLDGPLGVRGECDHIIKRSQGGDDKASNLEFLCPSPCHRGPKGKHG
jgi:5-methylcytosine-specific restriction endonuclease McrA